jgi:outer membrane protein assembly factor BamB
MRDQVSEAGDWRNIKQGWEIPTASYSDQPYIVKTDDGAWLCCVTTGASHEGEPGQVVTTMRSADRGRTWSQPLPLEPPGSPEASYAVMLKTPAGRIYIFYNHNSENIREIPSEPSEWFPGGVCKRVDSLGYFVFKYSDDGGRSWSPRRYPIPVREMEIDRKNPFGGKIRYFWNVGKPFVHDGAAFVSLHKVGGIGEGFFTRSEGVLLKSTNILTEPDPAKITWETLPDGDYGLRTPPGGGPIAEEQSYVVLSDGAFYVTYRTIDGYPVEAYSRDGGHTWSTPQYRRYANGRLMKHPRAANFVWKCENGKYLYWFHNHGGRFIGEHPRRRTIGYEDRNPVWLCGGVEAESPDGKVICWSQPEIVLYDDDPYIRMSYPDLVEEDGRYFLTETQKDKARVHETAPTLLEGLWGQVEPVIARGVFCPEAISRSEEIASAQTTGLAMTAAGVARDPGLTLPVAGQPMPAAVELPPLPPFLQRDSSRADYGAKDLRAGFSLDLWVRFDALDAGQVLLDNRIPEGIGFALQTTGRGAVEIILNDGRTESRWDCDPGVLAAGKLHHLTVIVDGGPKIITFVTDGALNDGGDARQFGWGRYNPNLRGATRFTHRGASASAAKETLRVGPNLCGEILALRIYYRALRTSEAISNYRHGPML